MPKSICFYQQFFLIQFRGIKMQLMQGRLNGIIGLREKQCTGSPTYTTTYRNRDVNVDTIKHIFIVLVFSTNSKFKH